MTAVFKFHNSAGETLDMATELLRAPRIEGLEAPVWEQRVIATPLRPGERFIDGKAGARFITSGLLALAGGGLTLAERRRDALRKLNPDLGLGVLEIRRTGEDASYYIDAIVAARELPQEGAVAARGTVQFRCPFPWFRRASPTETEITIASGNNSASETITNEGDVASYPVVSVTGPNVQNPAWENETTGETLSFSARTSSPGSGDELVVDHQNMTAVLDGDTNYMDRLTNGSVFWALAVGDNTVEVRRTGGGGNKTFTVTHYDWFEAI